MNLLTRLKNYIKVLRGNKLTWQDVERFTDGFNRRTGALLDMYFNAIIKAGGVMPNNMLDVGCGKMYAKEYFAAKHGITYSGLDYKKRDNDTIVCDLNAKQFVENNYDMILLAGVIEYIHDTDWLFDQITNHSDRDIVMSYCTIEKNSDVDAREKCAWVNAMSGSEIIESMAKRNFKLVNNQSWQKNTDLYYFTRG